MGVGEGQYLPKRQTGLLNGHVDKVILRCGNICHHRKLIQFREIILRDANGHKKAINTDEKGIEHNHYQDEKTP